MVNVHGMARLGVLTVGLGIGAAWAQTPVASADSSSDWLSTIDSLLSGASPAADPAAVTDFQISFNGTDLFPTLGNEATATTVAGQFGLAIAFGDGASATAEGGTGDYALAGGTNALALAGGESTDTGANYNTAIDIGNNADPSTYEAGIDNGAYAGNADLVGSANAGTGTGSYDTAIDIGNNTNGANGGLDGAFAGAGGLSGGMGSGDGNNDTAIEVANNIGRGDNSQALGGNGNYASESGGATGDFRNAFAGVGNDNTAIGTSDNAQLDASGGNDNYAYLDGPANSAAFAGGGDSNIAYINDPFDAAGSPDTAFAGNGFSNDLAEVLFAHGNATADTANLLYDIVSLFGHFSGSF
jgi:hypothetical protein